MSFEEMMQDAAIRGDMIVLFLVLLGFLAVLVAVAGGLIVAFFKALRGNSSVHKARELDVAEARSFQELQRGFHRMEERIDALETLLMDRIGERSRTPGLKWQDSRRTSAE